MSSLRNSWRSGVHLFSKEQVLGEVIEEVVRAEGSPVLIMDKRVIQERYSQFCHEFPGAEIYYAVKANPDEEIVRFLRELNAGFEIASEGELDLLLRLGIPPQKVVSSNPVKSPAFIKSAYASGIARFAFDSYTEIEKLSQFAPGSRVYVRLSVSNEGSEWPLDRKFGIEVGGAEELLLQAEKKNLKPWGIAFHVGSQCVNPIAWAKAIEKSKEVWDWTTSEGIELTSLNVGGGFPIEYTKPVPPISETGRVIRNAIAKAFPGNIQVMLEPGRALVGEAGVLVATVIAKAVREGQKWLYLDVGVFNGLMETMGGIMYPLITRKDGSDGRWVVAGPSCDSVDVISDEVELPELEVGDRVYIISAGAYTTAYASHFDGFPIPKVCFI